MKRNLIFICVFGIFALAYASEKLSPVQLIKDADKHHGTVVTVMGKISSFEQKTSRVGNRYFVFKLKEGDQVIGVYSHGDAKPEVKDGVKVEVTGIYRKEKKVSNFTVKNEVDATLEKEKPYGIKKVD